jgi:hypothetical protein
MFNNWSAHICFRYVGVKRSWGEEKTTCLCSRQEQFRELEISGEALSSQRNDPWAVVGF